MKVEQDAMVSPDDEKVRRKNLQLDADSRTQVQRSRTQVQRTMSPHLLFFGLILAAALAASGCHVNVEHSFEELSDAGADAGDEEDDSGPTGVCSPTNPENCEHLSNSTSDADASDTSQSPDTADTDFIDAESDATDVRREEDAPTGDVDADLTDADTSGGDASSQGDTGEGN